MPSPFSWDLNTLWTESAPRLVLSSVIWRVVNFAAPGFPDEGIAYKHTAAMSRWRHHFRECGSDPRTKNADPRSRTAWRRGPGPFEKGCRLLEIAKRGLSHRPTSHNIWAFRVAFRLFNFLVRLRCMIYASVKFASIFAAFQEMSGNCCRIQFNRRKEFRGELLGRSCSTRTIGLARACAMHRSGRRKIVCLLYLRWSQRGGFKCHSFTSRPPFGVPSLTLDSGLWS